MSYSPALRAVIKRRDEEIRTGRAQVRREGRKALFAEIKRQARVGAEFAEVVAMKKAFMGLDRQDLHWLVSLVTWEKWVWLNLDMLKALQVLVPRESVDEIKNSVGGRSAANAWQQSIYRGMRSAS